ncbi:Rhodanese-like domain-containing protein [Plectosphaerella plurivora]|uniref:Rhodanese-like domain-containing protein n=1 Tax=Plectosphaerella plurivora TaxID=936078 RepID=A0A9P8UQ64_9PEZI|nr:Rhodanese-like domain-containing protein [Plectosphaerella plurivora]
MLSLLKHALVASTIFSTHVTSLENSGRSSFTPFLSVGWFSKNYKDPNLAIIDIRSATDYAVSHIPNSVNIPFNATSGWSTAGPSGEVLQLPPAGDIQQLLASAGVRWPHPRTRVAIAGPGGNDAAPRVALSIKYAGLTDDRVAVLNGGFPAWEAAGARTTTHTPLPRRGNVRADQDLSFISYIDEVASSRYRRDEGIYIIDRGHIGSALSLPTPDIFNGDGTFIDMDVLALRAKEALSIGAAPRTIIVYCHIGRQASTWVFLLNHVMGYDGVKLYDGSTQEWGRHYDLVLD